MEASSIEGGTCNCADPLPVHIKEVDRHAILGVIDRGGKQSIELLESGKAGTALCDSRCSYGIRPACTCLL